MTTSFTDGTITTTTSEQDLFDITANAYYGAYIFCHNMDVGDTFVIKIYVKDEEGATTRLYHTMTLSDVQTDPALFVPFLPATQFKISIQKTAGTNRDFTWQRIQVT